MGGVPRGHGLGVVVTRPQCVCACGREREMLYITVSFERVKESFANLCRPYGSLCVNVIACTHEEAEHVWALQRQRSNVEV